MESLDSRIAQVASGAVRRQLGHELHTTIQRGDYGTALKISDALILYPENEPAVLCNALWVVQPDNTGLPIDVQLARRFLAASTFRAGLHPPMHINAAGVYAHLGDTEAVLRHLLLAKQHRQDLAPFVNDPLFELARSHPRWGELSGTHGPVDEPTWIEVAVEACESGDFANAFPALWWFWSRTRSSRVADLIETVSERAGSRVGYQGEALERALQSAPETLRAEFNRSVRRGSRRGGGGATKEEAAKDEGVANLVWLADDAADPRFATGVLRILASAQLPPLKTVQGGLQGLLVNLEALRDKRIAAGLAELSKALLDTPTILESWLAIELARLSGVLDALPEPALTQTERQGCTRLEALLGQRTAEVAHVRPNAKMPSTPKPVDPLIALWRKTRDPDVADVLDLQHMRSQGPDLVQAVTDAFIPGQGSARDLGAFDAAQLIWEAKLQEEPRLASALIRLFEDPPFLFPQRRENGVEEFWNEVTSACSALADPRLVTPLRELSARILSLTREADEEAEADMYMAFQLGPFLKAQLAKSADGIEAAGLMIALNPAQQELLEAAQLEYAPEAKVREQERLHEADSGVTESSLLDEVINDLDSDAPRLAYADFLGDTPRARFIRLQIEHATSGTGDLEAQSALQSEHQNKWVEPFSHMLEDLVFERGFLARCTFSIDPYGDPLPDDGVGHPLWATLHSIRSDTDTWQTYDPDLSQNVPSNTVEAFAHPVMRSLKHLDGVSVGGLLDLIGRGQSHYELITLEPQKVDVPLWPQVIASLSALTNLQTLRVRLSGRKELEGLLPLLEGSGDLSHLVFEIDAEDVNRPELTPPLAQALFASSFAQIKFAWTANNYDLGVDRYELRFTKSGESWGAEATQLPARYAQKFEEPPRAPTQLWLQPFITQLKQLPKDLLGSFRLRKNSVLPSQSSLDSLKELLRSFPRLDTLELLPPGDSPEEIQRLILALADPEQAERACDVLGSFRDPAARDALAHHAAHNEVLSVRSAALEALAELADESVVPALCEALDATAAGVMAARLLGYLRAQSAIPALIDYAPRIESSHARSEVAQAFTRIVGPEAIPVLLESYEKDASPETLIALGRLGAPEARDLAITALEDGRDGACVALAFVGKPEDSKLLEPFFDSRMGVTHIRAIPLLATLAIMPDDASPTLIDRMAAAIEKSWSSGVSEDCAWLALELRSRLGTPGAKWSTFTAQLLEWCESCLAWSQQVRSETPFGLHARKWVYWEELLHEVVAAWRSPSPIHSVRTTAP